ncbi:GNAT family N-acetyltransferase [Kibdelosporangium persicum]|uniref:N-acetyltransferase n=1 Tax=Kibdelosporangium persicum TaxID=2698649 RepID=A0ABX2F0F4_9PSEU|nr:GNAT family N-acetyltransferase [Kibdelosporangium persicum]NRN64427.1 N-acetyltransferase [Kibdelosporangium persicum]
MSKIVLRAARPGEAAALGELALRSKAHWGYDRDFLDACRAELSFRLRDVVERGIVVAAEGDRLLGFYSVEGRAPEGELAHMWLEPSEIGKGLGKRLWRHAMESARAAGFTVLTIDAEPAAEGFYLAMGAVKVGETPSGSIPGRVLPRLRADLPTPLLEKYDRHVRASERTDLEDGVHAETDDPVTRIVGRRQGYAGPPRDLSGVDVDALIARQRDFFAARGQSVEWQTRAHDLPGDMPSRLLAAGFQPDEKETVMIGTAAGLAAEPVLAGGIRVRRTDDDADMHRIAEMTCGVWGPGFSWVADMLVARKKHLAVFVAEADGQVVSAGWLAPKQDREFAGLFGGTTAVRWRGRGIYRALVARRARLAVELGIRYLWVDASDDSRPILERLGFIPVTTTTAYVWNPAT